MLAVRWPEPEFAEKLAGFDGDGDGKGLRGMKLGEVTLIAKGAEAFEKEGVAVGGGYTESVRGVSALADAFDGSGARVSRRCRRP